MLKNLTAAFGLLAVVAVLGFSPPASAKNAKERCEEKGGKWQENPPKNSGEYGCYMPALERKPPVSARKEATTVATPAAAQKAADKK